MSELSPSERTLRARIAAESQHAQGKTNTAPAREAAFERFLNEVDPGHTLPEAERIRRAEHARKSHMARLAYLSSRARSKRKGQS